MFKNLLPKKYIPTGEPVYKYYTKKSSIFKYSETVYTLFHVFVDNNGKHHAFKVKTFITKHDYDTKYALKDKGYTTKDEYIINTL